MEDEREDESSLTLHVMLVSTQNSITQLISVPRLKPFLFFSSSLLELMCNSLLY